jgi:SAM-dependent methyltransferase
VLLSERVELYNQSFRKYPDSALHASSRWISGTWVLGNDYRGTGMYGSYPPGYMDRIETLFPDQKQILHIFSGSLWQSATRNLVTLDSRITPEVKPGVQGSVLALPFLDQVFDLCYSDPPYSEIDAERYQTKLPDRRKVLYEVHRIIRPGGFLVWMDTTIPMYRKDMWNWCGAISLWRSTNHRIRGVMIFERMP